MGYVYVAKAPATPTPLPDLWPSDWAWPSVPWFTTVVVPPTGGWPPGWPLSWATLGGVAYTLTVSVPATIDTGAQTVTCTTLDSGVDTSDLYAHALVLTAYKDDGTVVQIRKDPADSFADSLLYQVENYSGSSYGISEDVYFDVGSLPDGENVTLEATVPDVFPTVTGTDSATVSIVIVWYGGRYGTYADGKNIVCGSATPDLWSTRTLPTTEKILCVAGTKVLTQTGWYDQTLGTFTAYSPAWTIRAPAIASGSNLVTTDSGNKVSLSTNGGGTWSRPTITISISGLYILPATGGRLFAFGLSGGTPGKAACVYSDNNGASWTAKVIAAGSWLPSITAWVNGTSIYAAFATALSVTHVYVSADNGASWTDSGTAQAYLGGFGVALASGRVIIGTQYEDGGGSYGYTDDNGLTMTAFPAWVTGTPAILSTGRMYAWFAGPPVVMRYSDDGVTWVDLSTTDGQVGVPIVHADRRYY